MIRKKWILLADGNPAEADQTLQALGASFAPPDVMVARDGAAVCECLARGQGPDAHHTHYPALVLLELNLAGVDSWEVLRWIKDDAQRKAIPVVVFTSSFAANDLNRSYQLGANAYVVKPTNQRELTAVLEDIRAFWIAVNEPPLDAAEMAEAKQLAVAA